MSEGIFVIGAGRWGRNHIRVFHKPGMLTNRGCRASRISCIAVMRFDGGTYPRLSCLLCGRRYSSDGRVLSAR